MTEKRFMVDDAGTLIDMQTRDTFDYVSDVCELLNELDKENRKLKNELNLSKLNLKEKNEGFDKIHKMYMEQIEENKELKKKLESKQRLINAYDNYIKTLKEDGVLE